MTLDKWKKSVIHLECANDSEPIYKKLSKIEALSRKEREGKIVSFNDLLKTLDNTRDERYQGTAILLKKNERHFLITAYHLLWDDSAGIQEYNFVTEDYKHWPEGMKATLLKNAEERYYRAISKIIYRVPSLNEILDGRFSPEFLMNLGAGASNMAPYTYSSYDIDLAVISLDKDYYSFTEELLGEGFVPITLDDIDGEPKSEGQDVFTVGFPGGVSIVNQQNKSKAQSYWSSNDYPLPVFSFGKVAMLNEHLDYFWTDMSTYPGNSGGPVVCEDKLVGIVIENAGIEIENSAEKLQMRIPFGKIIKAKHIFELIKIQEQKDKMRGWS